MEKTRMVLNLVDGSGVFELSERSFTMLAESFPSISFVRTGSIEELERELAHAEFAASWEFPVELYAKAPRLRALFTPAAGRERVARDPNGKVSVYFGSYHGELMAETLLGFILCFNRQLLRVLENQREHRWQRDFLSSSRRLRDQHIVIVGFGNIGRACAALLKPFGCRVTGVRRSRRDPVLDRDADSIVTFEGLSGVLPGADHVVIILPSDTGTDRIITRDHFRAMKRSACLYNLGRGNCYAEEDLVWAIESGTIAGAGLDVYEREPLPAASRLWDLPNVIVLPHSSALYPDYMDLFAKELAGRLREVVDGR